MRDLGWLGGAGICDQAMGPDHMPKGPAMAERTCHQNCEDTARCLDSPVPLNAGPSAFLGDVQGVGRHCGRLLRSSVRKAVREVEATWPGML